MSYHMPPHLRFCDVSGKTILLDLASNQYRGLTGITDVAFRAAMSGEQLDENLALIVGHLCREGLLEKSCSPPDVQMPPPATDALLSTVGRATILRIAEAFWATFLASQFKRMPLIDMERRLACQRDRSKRRPEGNSAGLEEILSAHTATSALVPSHDRCLDRSISLAWVCAAHGHGAELIIGVSVPPFNAHAWVQLGTTVLNDTVERVRQYQPIHRI